MKCTLTYLLKMWMKPSLSSFKIYLIKILRNIAKILGHQKCQILIAETNNFALNLENNNIIWFLNFFFKDFKNILYRIFAAIYLFPILNSFGKTASFALSNKSNSQRIIFNNLHLNIFNFVHYQIVQLFHKKLFKLQLYYNCNL